MVSEAAPEARRGPHVAAGDGGEVVDVDAVLVVADEEVESDVQLARRGIWGGGCRVRTTSEMPLLATDQNEERRWRETKTRHR